MGASEPALPGVDEVLGERHLVLSALDGDDALLMGGVVGGVVKLRDGDHGAGQLPVAGERQRYEIERQQSASAGPKR